MAERRIITLIPERVTRMKTAMFGMLTIMDRYRVGAEWYPVSNSIPDTPVDEVVHFHRHVTETGDTVILHTIEGQIMARVLVTEIRMMHSNQLTLNDINDLGYESHEEYMDDWDKSMFGRVWFMRIQHLDVVNEHNVLN